MTSDELLDAHMQRLRDDPGYVAIWRRAHEQPHMQEIVLALAWAEQADGLRAMAVTQSDALVVCPLCGARLGVKVGVEGGHV